MNHHIKNSHLFGSNAPFVEELYENYLLDPDSISIEWRKYFDSFQENGKKNDVLHSRILEGIIQEVKKRRKTVSSRVEENSGMEKKQVSVLQLINAHRFLGIQRAQIDPLKRFDPPEIKELKPEHYELNEADLELSFNTGSFVGEEQMRLSDLYSALQETYCQSIGLEYMYISDVQQKRWIQQKFESVRSKPSFSPEIKKHFLERLTAAEILEKYLHTRYVGQKRFSLEGGESLIVALDHMLQRAGSSGAEELVIGMAHRGRLNVLVNTMGKTPNDLFSEFEGNYEGALDDSLTQGDVKYHQGFSADVVTPAGPLHVSLSFNPSHLEIVNPVVEGSVRARQHRRKDYGGKEVIPVLIHGDAAFGGQGVVMETLNLYRTRGYKTGGTVHLVLNNQIGFTTSDPRDTGSTLFCTDVVKMIEAPVFHVNGDDPEAVALVTEIAVDFRMQFGKDVVIDLVCFRKLGHNEQDEPMVTQPMMYSLIKKHPGTRKKYADKLELQGVIEKGQADEMIKKRRASLDAGVDDNKSILANHTPPHSVDWKPYKNIPWTFKVDTGVKEKELKELSRKITTVPEKFKLHSRVEKVLADRRAMGAGKLLLDWGMAENLAYASLLMEGYPVRISGQDAGRGTFFHRHVVLHDQNRTDRFGGTFVPLQNISENQPEFIVIDSLLSEEAVLGFEYGYATAEPNELVIWEAQFGDFANGAQVVIDQFIASGEVKWGRITGLVMMLPHGYEGQGPEHSSARVERYLQLCADYNMQVCVPSTPSQMFHLLRRQMVRPFRKPLIIITPKSLLRHKESVSELKELTSGEYKVVIGDKEIVNHHKIQRVVFCSGKVFYELDVARRERKIKNIALVRIEQLYPFPHEAFKEQIDLYKNAKEIVWCQEEPSNQGAWHRIQHYLLRHLRSNQTLSDAQRASAASPAGGYMGLHNLRQKEVIDTALTLGI